ncbi:MAG TPA: hypothetical protein PKI93_06410 [Alphaproteobacteria bacterium]|nr:hypothetical protein [Alphaproteobacteria bacterium]HNS44164.1 hypothetical protein [Alphaproteobacteria bacterium]
MTHKPRIVTADKIKRGDIISLNDTNKLGLVYKVMYREHAVNGFEIIPIYLHDKYYNGQNDNNNFMIPNKLKAELGLGKENQYRVHYILENIATKPGTHLLKYAQTAHKNFGEQSMGRMTAKIIESRRTNDHEDQDERVIIFRDNEPQHVKDRRKPSGAVHLDVTLDDALKLQLIDNSIHDILEYGRYNGKKITSLKQAFTLASSVVEKDKNHLTETFKSGAAKTKITLDEAFDTGLINESNSFEIWQENGITTLAEVIDALEKDDDILDEIDEYDIEHLETFPIEGLKMAIKSAWHQLGEMADKKDATLIQSGIPYMYPSRTRG